jgi:hypothetical protein
MGYPYADTTSREYTEHYMVCFKYLAMDYSYGFHHPRSLMLQTSRAVKFSGVSDLYILSANLGKGKKSLS